MGKTVIIVSFLLCFAMALWLFFSRDTVTLRENMEKAPAHKKPRVVLERFIIRRYHQDAQQSQLKAGYGDFKAPNLVELKGGVKGWQLRNGEKHKMLAGRALAEFDSTSLTELLDEKKGVDTAFLKDHVQLDFHDHTLRTEEAQYITRQQLVTGHKPVRVTGPSRWFTGQDGFRYDLQEEVVNVYGKVRGMVQPDAAK